MTAGPGGMLTVFVVSDSTGETAERLARAALTQFGPAPVRVVRRGDVLAPEQVRAVVQEASQGDSIILHTLVSDELRRLMLEQSRLHGVDSLDVMGPMLDRIATRLKITPQEKPGLFRQLIEAKSREIEAVAFAFRHDDGHNADELGGAEVVLVGPSRSMKTPTMLYLAYRGWFAANVPIILEMSPPEALAEVPSERVFCLLIGESQLQGLRRARADGDAIPAEPYTSLEYIRRELLYSRQLCRERRWRGIDVTGKSVEEVSREIIALLPKERPRQRPAD
jgi:regulator of PEP synthase PpsR (kinase-PPPase family)